MMRSLLSRELKDIRALHITAATIMPRYSVCFGKASLLRNRPQACDKRSLTGPTLPRSPVYRTNERAPPGAETARLPSKSARGAVSFGILRQIFMGRSCITPFLPPSTEGLTVQRRDKVAVDI